MAFFSIKIRRTSFPRFQTQRPREREREREREHLGPQRLGTKVKNEEFHIKFLYFKSLNVLKT